MARKFVYTRGKRYYCRLRNEVGKWINKPTPFNVPDEDKAEEFARTAQQLLDGRRESGVVGALSVRAYSEQWVDERKRTGIRSAKRDSARLRDHALPKLGSLALEAVQTHHVRDLVNDHRAGGKLGNRTIIGVYRLLYTMFETAKESRLIATNPCSLKRKDLPKLRDRDPEWRAEATYSVREVERLISDPAIPMQRRVMYALKAIAGLRHAEAAALHWRHLDRDREPLASLLVANVFDNDTRQERAGTKTEVSRRVPVHPTLAALLATWKLSGWAEAYGRMPTDEDLIVPTIAVGRGKWRPSSRRGPVTLRHTSAQDSQKAIVADLGVLKLRLKAGKDRNRGGHDLRSWFITTAQEHGAHRDLLRVVTHGLPSDSPRDVMSGYTRATWSALCAEVSKLQIELRTEEVTPIRSTLVTAAATSEHQTGNRVEIRGVERLSGSTRSPASSRSRPGKMSQGDRVGGGDGTNSFQPDLAVIVADLDEIAGHLRSMRPDLALEVVGRMREVLLASVTSRPIVLGAVPIEASNRR